MWKITEKQEETTLILNKWKTVTRNLLEKNKSNPIFFTAIFLALGIILLFSYVCSFGFTTGEEYWFTQNFTWEEVKEFFTKSTWPSYRIYYRPLVQALYTVDYFLWGYSEFGYHIDTLVLYAVLCALIFVMIKLLARSWLISLASIFFFVFFPSHSHQIGLVTHRGDTIPLIFLALMGINQLKNNKTILRSAINLVLLILSFFSKENTVVFMSLLFLMDLYQYDFDLKKLLNRQKIMEYTAYFLITVVFLWFRLIFLPGSGILESAGINLSPVSFAKAVFINSSFVFFTTESFGKYPFHLTFAVLFWNFFLWKIFWRYLPISYTVVFVIMAFALRLSGVVSILYLFAAIFCLVLLVFLYYLFFPRQSEPFLKKIGFSSMPDRYVVRTYAFAVGWIVLNNIIMVSKYKERLNFNASLGVAVLIALAVYMIIHDHKSKIKKAFALAPIAIFAIMYAQAITSNINLYRPEQYYAFQHQLVWYPGLTDTKLWPGGRTADPERIQELRNYLLKYHLIDKDNTLTIRPGYLEELAYKYLEPHRFNVVLFGLDDNKKRPGYLVDSWVKQGWGVKYPDE